MPAGGSLNKDARKARTESGPRHPNLPEIAMVLAAGFGTRIGHLLSPVLRRLSSSS